MGFLRKLRTKIDFDSIIIFDNASIHHAKLVNDFLIENSICFKYLPPYSPFLNPIEFSFSKIKTFVRSTIIKNKRSLIVEIENALASITEDDFIGWYRNIHKYFRRCLNKEEIYF